MEKATTRGVKVSVESFYQPDYSNPSVSEYMFAYRITILNQGEHALKLLRRHWFIVDAYGQTKEVEGEGVVGEQPVIASGEFYQYISGCNIRTDLGKMYGTYLMQRLSDGKMFYVNIRCKNKCQQKQQIYLFQSFSIAENSMSAIIFTKSIDGRARSMRGL